MKVILIGAGIGGLAAAIALRRVGVETAVFEQAERLREVGAGLTIWANAIKALHKIDAAHGLLKIGSAVERLEVRSWRGGVLAVTPLATLSRKLGVPVCICVHRGEFLNQLACLVDPRTLHCGARCAGFAADDSRVRVWVEDGRKECGDILVGADGLHSVVGAQLHGELVPRYAGYTCWRGLASFEHKALPPGTGFEAWGPGKRFAAHHCGPGRIFWYATANTPAGVADARGGHKAEVGECFQDWFSPIPELIEATQDLILRNDIVDRKPLKSWSKGRVTLLGDAAHTTTPNLGQGACQAIEDAVDLAGCFRNGAIPEAILRAYEDMRIPRTTTITNQSLRLGILGQLQNPLACTLRDTVVRFMPPAISLRFMESILHHSAPDLP